MITKYSKGLYSYDEEEKVYSETGSAVVPSYQLDFPSRGGVCLKQTGEKPLYEMIQANLVNCDLQNVIESCVHSNQYAVCTQDNLNTMISDFTGVSNLADLYMGTKRIENTWKELPLEVRESFDSDIKKFIRGIGTDEFDEKVSSGFDKFYGSMQKNTAVDIVPPVDTSNPTPSEGVTVTPETTPKEV